jgi:hypothetical protein
MLNSGSDSSNLWFPTRATAVFFSEVTLTIGGGLLCQYKIYAFFHCVGIAATTSRKNELPVKKGFIYQYFEVVFRFLAMQDI